MKKLITLLLLAFSAITITAQTKEELIAKAQKFKSEYNYKEALPLYQSLLKSDSNNVAILHGASYIYTKYGYYFAPDAEKMKYYTTAGYLASKAIKLDEKSGEAHCAYAMALGRIYENASSSQKIANSKVIKSELDKAIQYSPRLAGAYHVLGRWHRTIAGFNMFEKAMINTFFGGVPPGGTYDDAIKSFMTAISIEPKFMLHKYELAVTYNDMGKTAEAKAWLKLCLEITPVSPDDFKAKKDAEALLKKLD